MFEVRELLRRQRDLGDTAAVIAAPELSADDPFYCEFPYYAEKV